LRSVLSADISGVLAGGKEVTKLATADDPGNTLYCAIAICETCEGVALRGHGRVTSNCPRRRRSTRAEDRDHRNVGPNAAPCRSAAQRLPIQLRPPIRGCPARGSSGVTAIVFDQGPAIYAGRWHNPSRPAISPDDQPNALRADLEDRGAIERRRPRR